MYKEFIRLQGRVQHYSWGRALRDSCLRRFSLPGLDESKPCAELWLGAHPSLPATVLAHPSYQTVDELIADHPEALLGEPVVRRFGPRLPFLFKVLSICTPLSIQAHPDTALAEALHASDPAHYPDPYHKPECALAVSEVQLLYGFRAAAEVRSFLDSLPELATLVPTRERELLNAAAPDDLESVKELYRAVLHQPAQVLAEVCRALGERLSANRRNAEEQWVHTLLKDYPDGDPGLISFFILRLETLAPGELIFIGPNTPHAYLCGELIECMAGSDNVVRAGLTPKHKDIEVLLRMIAQSSAALERITPQRGDGGWEHWAVPAPEFALQQLQQSVTGLPCRTNGRVQLLFCFEGTARLESGAGALQLSPGDAVLIPACLASYQLTLTTGRLFRVIVPDR